MGAPTMRRIKLIVSLDWPEGASATDMRAFVREAVDMSGGQLEPPGTATDDMWNDGDPLFGCDKHTAVRHTA